jgi:endonuclease/exonuclease/phosphatase (EEP) superfamily protein YafD
VGAWSFLALLGGVVLVRLAHADDSPALIAAIGMAPWASFLLWPVAAYGLRTRRKLLAAVAVVGIAAQVVWVWPQFDPLRQQSRPPAGWDRLRVLDANVTWTNRDMDGLRAQIERFHPEIVTLEEVTPADLSALAASPVLAGYRWRLLLPAELTEGMAIWSDLPLRSTQRWAAGAHPEIRTHVVLGHGRALSLLVVHTYTPMVSVKEWKRELADIAVAAKALTGPRLVIGDFNATSDMYEFGDIVHTGLADAAARVGRGYDTTWTPWSWLPPVLLIDHALVSPGVAVVDYRQRRIAGSQHRGVLVDLAVQ